METLHASLNQRGYICSQQFADLVEAALHNAPVAGAFLNGAVGTGKSFLTEVLHEILPSSYHFYQCFPGTREDDLLLTLLPNEQAISGIATYDGVILETVKQTRTCGAGERVILVLDEWDKTRPSADSFLLSFLQSGRIRYASYDLCADLSKLLIFLTLNMERELSEPLLRRLPMLDFEPLQPSLVFKALRRTHPKHPFLYSAVVLYERTLQAELPKPATIQELRQLLDALSLLGTRADWDALVFQFVTKTEENHALLQRAEQEQLRRERQHRSRLDVRAYSPELADAAGWTSEAQAPELPSLKQAKGFDAALGQPEDAPDAGQAGGILQLSDRAYDAVVRLVEAPSEEPHRLGDLAEVHGSTIALKEPVPLRRIEALEPLWGAIGEVLVTEPTATLQDVKALQGWSSLRIVKYSSREALARADGIDLRWTPETGAEIIVNLRRKRTFQECFGSAWGAAGENKWIGSRGLIYSHYHGQTAEEA